MSDILTEIVEYKKKVVEISEKKVPVTSLKGYDYFERKTFSLKQAILQFSHNAIIAEFKRHSPSKGQFLSQDTSSINYISKYKEAQAVGVSILTDEKFFKGSKEDIMQVRSINIPILRKDFIISPYQIFESKAIGADVVLLIASVLSKQQIEEFTKLAHSLGLEVWVEIHHKEEAKKLNSMIDMVGVNNRDLKSFQVSFHHSKTLLSFLPKHSIKVSESGIKNPDDLLELKQMGFEAFLIGESIVRNNNPEQFLKELVNC